MKGSKRPVALATFIALAVVAFLGVRMIFGTGLEGLTNLVYLPTATCQDCPSTAQASATPTTMPATEPTATPTPASTGGNPILTSWLVNTNNATSPIFSGVEVNVQSVYSKTVSGVDYVCITASDIPDYEHTVTESDISWLNSRPKAAADFVNGVVQAVVGQVVKFGENIGYASSGCSANQDGYGFWPPGPACPTDQSKDLCFPATPTPATAVCETGLNDMGAWVNGVAAFNWQDGFSYNNQGVWENDAFHFERYDLDICPGHSATGNYHHHSDPSCLGEELGDTGTGHSPVYGFAADGYAIYGPWHADGVLAQSCWVARDYSAASPTGCGVDGERSCLLVDQMDISQGTTPASFAGPHTDATVTSLSGNSFIATSGYYFQDYYYDAVCTAQGGAALDEHNGHDHDGLGYHYHTTRTLNADLTFSEAFPYMAGPTYAGTLPAESFAMCGGGTGGPGGGPGGGGPPPRP